MSHYGNSRFFTDYQKKQHSHLQGQLQRANAEAAQTLLALGALSADDERTRHFYTDLLNVVRRMNLLLKCCEVIVDSASEQSVERIVVVLGLTCEVCENKPRNVHDRSAQTAKHALAVDPAWGIHVMNLLSVTISALCRTVAGSQLGESEASGRCLADLSKALRRQQRHLARIGRKHIPEIVATEDFSNVCPDCGHISEPLDYDDDDPETNSNDGADRSL